MEMVVAMEMVLLLVNGCAFVCLISPHLIYRFNTIFENR